MTMRIHCGSILEVSADALVNPANSFLRHSGGLAFVIDRCAFGNTHNANVREDWPLVARGHDVIDVSKVGPGHQEEWTAYIDVIREYSEFRPGLVPTGAAVLGPPGALCRRFKAIIHAVGPIWGGGNYLERSLLFSAYAEALSRAEKAGFESIAFPAISAGVFGVPIDVVATVAVRVCQSTDLDVIFALMADDHVAAFEGAMNRRNVERYSGQVKIP
jgi:O-acetyl-ADP-ribose deacetylase (regulator of RNase III)